MLEKYYQPNLVEGKIYDKWEKEGDFIPKEGHLGIEPYSIVIPPPNVTGSLHMGHALNNTLQDILIRFYRLKGKSVLWQPGTDHAGIATEMVVERELKKKNIFKNKLSREEFTNHVWAWKESSGNKIINQLKRLGCSCDWSRERFTLDEGLSKAVKYVFVKLYNDGLIYKDKRLSNWDPKLKTTISDLEVIQKEVKGHLWYIEYKIENEEKTIVVATTRPETILGDTAIAVNPNDKRYKELVGKFAILPLINRKIPIVTDEYAKADQGTGAVKITPAHDFNDYDVGKRHNLEIINIFNENAELNANCPKKYQGLSRVIAREKILKDLKKIGALLKSEENIHTVPFGDRSGEIIEPWLTDQWFVDAKQLSVEAVDKVKSGDTKFIPKSWEKTYFEWMQNIQPWCISRQLIWGHRIPAWYGPDGKIFVAESLDSVNLLAKEHYKEDVILEQDNDVLDTWFSSALWPFSTLGWPEETDFYAKYYPTSTLVTGFDIIFFWVARMMMMALYFTKKVPFSSVYVHALVRDEKGQKMSKSKGNVIDPIILMDEFGADALRMTLCSMAAQGRDIKLSKEKIQGYRNFITKIWNAVKFCQLNDCNFATFDMKNINNPFNLWILNEYEKCRSKTEKAIETYKFNEAANELYKFTWNIFCDWYLEFSKVIFQSKNMENINETRGVTSFVLSNILIMLHPIIPFFTEHVWQQASNILNRKCKKINKSSWPEKIMSETNKDTNIERLIELISAIRSARAEFSVPGNSKINVFYFNNSNLFKDIVLKHQETLISLTNSKNFIEKEILPEDGMMEVLFDDGMVYLEMKDAINIKEERLRLEKNLNKINLEIVKIEKKLENKNFIENAPNKVIDEQKSRLKNYIQSVTKINKAMEKLI
tara:strand:- start:5918 stop:8563 length:2646 start_codon:yes stop_codon:yes gene_type:complete